MIDYETYLTVFQDFYILKWFQKMNSGLNSMTCFTYFFRLIDALTLVLLFRNLPNCFIYIILKQIS